MTTTDFDHIFGTARVMAILRGLPVAETVRLAERAWDLGIDVVEVPVATPDAVPALRAAVEAGRERGRIVGAGTVLDESQVVAAADAGAAFTVAPGLDLAIPGVSIRPATAGGPGRSGSSRASATPS
ncbi:2-dehydro-3-deoxyphosphogluconate aldolase, partial [Micromonospora profundi]